MPYVIASKLRESQLLGQPITTPARQGRGRSITGNWPRSY